MKKEIDQSDSEEIDQSDDVEELDDNVFLENNEKLNETKKNENQNNNRIIKKASRPSKNSRIQPAPTPMNTPVRNPATSSSIKRYFGSVRNGSEDYYSDQNSSSKKPKVSRS